MYKPNYEVTKGKLALIIFDLATHEGKIKERLISVFTERYIDVQEFPDELQDDWRKIYSFLTFKGNEGGEINAIRNSLFRRKSKTCSEWAKKVIALYCKLEGYCNDN